MRKQAATRKVKPVKSSVNSEAVHDIIKKVKDTHKIIDSKMLEMVQICSGPKTVRK